MAALGTKNLVDTISADGGSDIIKSTYELNLDGKSKKTLFCTEWRQKNTPVRAVVFVCHGYGEYIGRPYEAVGRALAAKGFLAFGHDHMGHGQSCGMDDRSSTL